MRARVSLRYCVAAALRFGALGSAQFTDSHGHTVIGGYDPVEDLHWTVIAQESADTLLAPVTSQRQRAILIVTLGALLAIAAALAFGTLEARKLRSLAQETASEAPKEDSAMATTQPGAA